MSHFTVLVITDEEPTDEVLHQKLLPFHEYECTGFEEYIQDVDITDEVLEQFNEPVKVIVLADGSYHSRWDDKFYTKKPEKEDSLFSRNEFELPEGAREEELSADTARAVGMGPKTMAEAADDCFGSAAFERFGRWFRRTNPNKQWDWYVRGGRWRGMLKIKQGALAYHGRPGVFDNGPMRSEGVDSCQIKALDLEGMRNEVGSEAGEAWDTVHKVIAGRDFETWEEVRKKHATPENSNIDAAREEYSKQPVVENVRKNETANQACGFFDGPDKFRVSREEYVQTARDRAIQTFAVLKDGQWYERGRMGWWAVVHDEKDREVWDIEFAKLLDGLSPEAWITVVDCHI